MIKYYVGIDPAPQNTFWVVGHIICLHLMETILYSHPVIRKFIQYVR